MAAWAEGPAEDGGVEGLDALEVEAGDFGPGDCLVLLVGGKEVGVKGD